MKKIFLPLCMTVMMTTYAWADTAPTQTGKDNRVASRSFKSLDTNNDGVISKQEASTNGKLSKDFDKYDANHDGQLDFGEFSHYEGSVETHIQGVETPLEKKPKGTSTPPPPAPVSPNAR